ncbi:SRPBCC domain-containing protein [Demequina sp.]|uniref:SRPBCC domain-containing protein n=1 Tax=Demequina sp. TaxID=2050685 RepID=UPI0025D2F039|nr:SRPBCC domain-containing protein [Demequina sp.]
MVEISFDVPAEPCVLVETTRLAHPPAQVWTAYTEPIFLRQWWAPHGYTNSEVELDVRPGGPWKVTQADPEGNTFSFYGHFERVEPRSLLACTFISELFPEVLTWLRVDMAGTPTGTAVVTTHRFPDDYHRTGYINLGGVERMRESTERLDALLRTMS